ncbi:MAG: 5-(carboxyamino)imidazole ribonucleotide mutase [Candidatus Diapherotrites archaeon]|nr:5-(carboxyamino)imidazole ribonucleotide mutase [Candidatus Diapherotrites archaeon]
MAQEKTRVAIVMGSDSDLPTMKEAAEVLDAMGISYFLTVVSAHRTPERLYAFARGAHEQFEVVIAGAGGAAHLPGMIAALTELPVIGVPIRTSTLNGVDSLHSIVQMPPGIPVAAVAIGNAKNAGLLAAQILGLKYPEVAQKVNAFRARQTAEVLEKAKKLEGMGWAKYLETKSSEK